MMLRAAVCLTFALALAACGGRAHLTRSHGSSSRSAFQHQAANPEAGQSNRPVAVLDSQEAEAIAQSHRRSMAPKGGSASQDSGIVLVAPNSQAPAPYVPPPSVPAEPAR